jgi:hypothetical protein
MDLRLILEEELVTANRVPEIPTNGNVSLDLFGQLLIVEMESLPASFLRLVQRSVCL